MGGANGRRGGIVVEGAGAQQQANAVATRGNCNSRGVRHVRRLPTVQNQTRTGGRRAGYGFNGEGMVLACGVRGSQVATNQPKYNVLRYVGCLKRLQTVCISAARVPGSRACACRQKAPARHAHTIQTMFSTILAN